MKFVSEPSNTAKVRKMQERVCWQHPQILQENIDQTALAIADSGVRDSHFSFLVIGDSGTGNHRHNTPQRLVAESLLKHGTDARFLLHTGDVVYLVGSSEQYYSNFIHPYREYLVRGDAPKSLQLDALCFKIPFLPVLGNHDYYNLPQLYGLVTGGILGPLRYLLRSFFDADVGWHGSYTGDAYAQAFLDYLKRIPEQHLKEHLHTHYTAETATGRVLNYQPGQFTKVPNRYYTFRYGGIDFFALDSNTFNTPPVLSESEIGKRQRRQIQTKRQQLEQKRVQVAEQLYGHEYGYESNLSASDQPEADRHADLATKLEQIDEQIHDIDKQLSLDPENAIDFEQLNWLRDRLVAS